MRDKLIQEVKEFLVQRSSSRKKEGGFSLLVAFSGGPDSTALLQLLLQVSKFFSLKLHVAHVDHGWRKESAQEAQQIRKRMEELGLCFHLHRLKRPASMANAEEIAREQRLRFFSELYQDLECDALVLGHQADDLAETVLKRIFEGASLSMLGGMEKVSFYGEMELWRPLLSIRKEQLMAWLEKRKIPFFIDSTNDDSRFLRGRMRMQMIPFIQKNFGKEITLVLGRLSHSAYELHRYLTQKADSYLQKMEQGRGFVSLNLAPFLPLEELELKQIVKSFGKRQGVTISFRSLAVISKMLNTRVLGKSVSVGGRCLEIDDGQLRFFSDPSNQELS